MQNAPINLDYQTSNTTSERAGKKHLIATLIWFYFCYLLIIAVLVVFVPKFGQIFKDFHFKLPAASMLLLDASDFCRRYYFLWGIFVPVPAILAVSNGVILSRTQRRWTILATVVIMVAFVIFVVVSLFLPMIDLIQGITTQSGKK